MKHIIPVITITALAAAASAEDAKQELSYNRIVVSRISDSNNQNNSSYSGTSVAAQAKLGQGFYVSAETINWGGNNNQDVASLGYAHTLPTFGSYTADLNLEIGSGSTYLVGLRSYVATGIELGLAYRHYTGGDSSVIVSGSYGLSSLAKGLSLNASYEHNRELNDTTKVGLAYNF